MVGHRPFRELADRLEARRQQPLTAFRPEVAVTHVARDIAEAEAQYERLVDAATALGFNFEHGVTDPMDQSEIIPGSPIDERLRPDVKSD